MIERPIIDAGPGLNFFSANAERLLIDTLGPLCAPECVRDEMLDKARRDVRFEPAARVLGKLGDRWMRWLPDDATDELEAVVRRISGLPIAQRVRRAADLGETFVIAHGVVIAESGADVVLLIDDQRGARIATQEISRLRRLGARGDRVGEILLVNTVTVLMKAAGTVHIPDRATMRALYRRLRDLDDSLVPIEQTPLLAPHLWR